MSAAALRDKLAQITRVLRAFFGDKNGGKVRKTSCVMHFLERKRSLCALFARFRHNYFTSHGVRRLLTRARASKAAASSAPPLLYLVRISIA